MKLKWTKETVLLEALKYTTRSEFYKKSSGALKASIRFGILDEARSHMPIRVDISGSNSVFLKWTEEKIIEEALKYTTRSEFQDKSGSAYSAARKMKIIDKVCSHMPIYDKKGESNPRFKWTEGKIAIEALKYKTKDEFRNGNRGAFEACKRKKILDKLCSHMPPLYKKWTDELLQEEALKYSHRSEFEFKNPSAYSAALKRKIMNKICKHMKRPSQSPQEKELMAIIQTIYPQAVMFRDMKVKIKSKPHIHGFDIDVFISELNKGIEFDGTYIHSFMGLKRGRKNWPDEDIKNYHKLKDKWFLSKGIQIFHIKEKDWIKDKQKCIKKCFDFLKSKV